MNNLHNKNNNLNNNIDLLNNKIDLSLLYNEEDRYLRLAIRELMKEDPILQNKINDRINTLKAANRGIDELVQYSQSLGLYDW